MQLKCKTHGKSFPFLRNLLQILSSTNAPKLSPFFESKSSLSFKLLLYSYFSSAVYSTSLMNFAVSGCLLSASVGKFDAMAPCPFLRQSTKQLLQITLGSLALRTVYASSCFDLPTLSSWKSPRVELISSVQLHPTSRIS